MRGARGGASLGQVLAPQDSRKDGKEHQTWSVVENRRVHNGRVVQRHVLHLGEINDSQRASWSRAIEAFDEGGSSTQIALFPEDRAALVLDCGVVSIRLSKMRLRRPRQWGACWPAMVLWGQLRLDELWAKALPPSREGASWLNVLKTLASYQLISPGSEWRLHRQWFDESAMGDLLGEDATLALPNNLYRCQDRLTEHKKALFTFLRDRWKDLFQADFEALLDDLTSTYFECDPPGGNPHRGPHLRGVPRLLPDGDTQTTAEGADAGTTSQAVLEKLAAIQMIDAELPTTDGPTIVPSHHTEPESDHLLLLQRLKLELPAQPPPKITAAQSTPKPPEPTPL